MKSEEKIIDATTALAKEVYSDVAKPVLSEVGKSAGGLTRTVLAPLNLLVWGIEKIFENIEQSLNDKLSRIPEDKITTPAAIIAVPAIEAMRYSGNIQELRNLYLNLIANSADQNNINSVHPSFVEIIKNLSPHEAKLLTAFIEKDSIPYIDLREQSDPSTGSFATIERFHSHILDDFNIDIDYPCKLPVYFYNLIRVGILEDPDNYTLTDDFYKDLENCENILKVKGEKEGRGKTILIRRGFLKLTAFGQEFINMVVVDK